MHEAHILGAWPVQALEPGSYMWVYLGKALTDTGPVKTGALLTEVSGGWMCVYWNPEKYSKN